MSLLDYNFSVVITPGRTGSQIINKNFNDFFKIKVDHTHNPLISCPDNSIAFISRRRNTFESIASTLVGKRTNEFTSYTNKILEPFEISKLEFTECFWFYQCYYHIIDKTKFARTIDVWYEDLINDPMYLFGLIGIDQRTDFTFPKSPYNYYQLITNIDQCQKWFCELETLPVSQNLIDSLTASIKSDLENTK